MNGKQGRALTRWAVAAAMTVAAVALPVGAASADEYHEQSDNGPRVALINGQVDDPMEDVLEHFLLLGGTHTWD
ncbi:hypothetical protein [Streptomyces sp. URMC 123]|uniref:hypothetical protein n=1 Tax=Streptomyces sp. URMC 123 TaxID=3423403 RepID=UPI003F1DFE63